MLVKQYNGAITLQEVIESHPALERLLYEIYDDEVQAANRERVRHESKSIIDSFRRR